MMYNINETNEYNDQMMDADKSSNNLKQLPHISIVTSVGCCIALSVLYVASLYIWNNKHDRDHPSTVKRRFCSVIVVMFIAPIFVYQFSAAELFERATFAEILGLRWQGFLMAVALPYLLTVLLFLGPLCVSIQNDTIRIFFDIDYWKDSFQNIIWIRNHIMAPLSEEFVFRACMMPLILQSFTPYQSIIITPLFFGIAHVHHINERINMGIELKTAIAVSVLQLTYTTAFGIYSAYLFARTGHFVAPFLVHAFCNHMGLPDLLELWQQQLTRRLILIGLYVFGLIGFFVLLPIAIEPTLYSNELYWNT